MHPWYKCSCTTQGYGKNTLLIVPLFLVEVDRKLNSTSKAYLLTHLLLTSLVPVAWMQAWVSQLKYVQLLQVALMMKKKWELLLPPLTWAILKSSRYKIDYSLPSGHHTSLSLHVTLSYFSWWLHDSIQCHANVLGDGTDNKAKKVHPCA